MNNSDSTLRFTADGSDSLVFDPREFAKLSDAERTAGLDQARQLRSVLSGTAQVQPVQQPAPIEQPIVHQTQLPLQ